MKNTMKKIASAILALSMTMALAACGAKETPAASSAAASVSGEMLKIGISQFGEHASLDNCRVGFLQGLTEAGLVEGTDYEVIIQNASFHRHHLHHLRAQLRLRHR